MKFEIIDVYSDRTTGIVSDVFGEVYDHQIRLKHIYIYTYIFSMFICGGWPERLGNTSVIYEKSANFFSMVLAPKIYPVYYCHLECSLFFPTYIIIYISDIYKVHLYCPVYVLYVQILNLRIRQYFSQCSKDFVLGKIRGTNFEF